MSMTMIGLDTAKSVFQVHAVNEAGEVVIRRKLRRNELIAFFEKQEACTVVMEACGAAHHWARVRRCCMDPAGGAAARGNVGGMFLL